MALETKCQENARAIAQQMKNSGGSGSEVTVTQVLTSGTKIATIKVDDDSTDLYCETVPATPEADDIAYDNTDSGLTATNVQDAIDELAQGGGGTGVWTLVGSVSGSSDINIPAGLSEIYVQAEDSNNNVYFSECIPTAILTDTDKQYTNGYNNQGSHTAFCGIYISSSKVHLQQMKIDSTVVTPTITVYGR